MEQQQILKMMQRNENERRYMKQSYYAYAGLDIPIQRRKFDDETKINNKLSNQFRTEIVDQVTGYLFGNPVTYQLDSTSYSESLLEQYSDYFKRFLRRNMIEDLDAETGTYMAACGKAVRMAYIDVDGYERMVNLKPWEVTVFEDTEGNTRYALWEHEVEQLDGTKKKMVEFYDSENVVYLMDGKQSEPVPHGFKHTPVWQIKNNEQEQSDFMRVESLIDAYDRLTSDAQNELEEFRLAYMYYKGFSLGDTDEEAKENTQRARQTGGFEIPEEGEIGFITKQINDVFVENHKKTLADNVYKFSRTVDMSDEAFSGGTQSGESRKWKLLSLENRAIMKERKFIKSLRYQWKVITSSFENRDIMIDPLTINSTFSRNTPVELLHEAEVQQKLMGLTSTETRLSLFSAVDDPQEEMEKMEAEQDIMLDYGDDDNEESVSEE